MRYLISLIMLCSFSFVFAEDIERAFFEDNPTLGGDVTIKSSGLKVVGEKNL